MRNPDRDEREFSQGCTRCGASLRDGEWHPVVTETDDSGISLYSFCDEECKAALHDGE